MSSDIRDAMAGTIWQAAYEAYTHHADTHRHARSFREPPVPTAAAKAARDLEKLYEKMNGVTSLDTLLARAEEAYPKHRFDPGLFGEKLAAAAIGIPDYKTFGSSMGVKVPTFEATYDGNELTWEGSDESRNPRERERERAELQQDLYQHEQEEDYSTGSRWHGRTVAETPAERSAYAKIGHHGGGKLRRKRNTSIEEDLGINPGLNVGTHVRVAGGAFPPEPKAWTGRIIWMGEPGSWRADMVQVQADTARFLGEGGPWVKKSKVRRINPDEDLDNSNPGQFTEKGERMYQDIKASYEEQGEPRAAEIAARTVWTKSKEVPGLVHVGRGRPPGVPNRSH